MRRIPNLLLILLVAALPVAAFASGVHHVTTDAHTKPGVPGYEVQRTPWDCSARQTFAPVVGWSMTVVDSTVGAPAILPGYACGFEWPEEGPEHIYRLEVAEELEFWAALTNPAADPDLDLFLLSGCAGDGCEPVACDTDSCQLAANEEFTAVLPPGTYFLVVDTYGEGNPPGGPYTLNMAGRWRGVPDGNCSVANVEILACGVADTVSGDLVGQLNLLETYDACVDTVSYLERGGEIWYAIDAPDGHMLSLTATPDTNTLDLALALFTECGPDAQCLAFVDAGRGGVAEVLDWPQAAGNLERVWLAVDAERAPLAGEGSFDLILDCGAVPTVPSSFGSFRARYR